MKKTILIVVAIIMSLIIVVGIIFALKNVYFSKRDEEKSAENKHISITSQSENSVTEDDFSNNDSQSSDTLNISSDSNSFSQDNSVSAPLESTNSSTEETVHVSPPEKVTEVFTFENLFVMPEPIRNVFYDSQNGNVLPYCFFLPDDYVSSEKYPVILFLHGAGETGTDNNKQLTNLEQMFKHNGDLTSNAIVICPQTNEWWNLDRQQQGDQGGTLGSALHLLDEIKQTYSCDDNRIYVMGLSMGGFATWNLLEEYGDIFAAGIPICGGGNSGNGAAFKDIPIRIFHGTADGTVSFSASQNMYNSIVNAGGQKVSFIKLTDVGHNAWDYAFSDRDTFSWLFAQNKATNPSCKYEYLHYFKITDNKGNIIISDQDILDISYDFKYGDDYVVTVDLVLNDNGKNKLIQAYTSNIGKTHTVYWATQKLYNFTPTKSTIDNVFSIVDIFDNKSFVSFYSSINKLNN